jgi:hypothetical protein
MKWESIFKNRNRFVLEDMRMRLLTRRSDTLRKWKCPTSSSRDFQQLGREKANRSYVSDNMSDVFFHDVCRIVDWQYVVLQFY